MLFCDWVLVSRNVELRLFPLVKSVHIAHFAFIDLFLILKIKNAFLLNFWLLIHVQRKLKLHLIMWLFCTNPRLELLQKMHKLIKNARNEIEDAKNPLFKFQSPPQTENEKVNVMKQVEKRLESQLKFLAGDEEFKLHKELKWKRLLDMLPQNVEIRRLEYTKTGSEIVIVGVDRYSYIHCSLIKDML